MKNFNELRLELSESFPIKLLLLHLRRSLLLLLFWLFLFGMVGGYVLRPIGMYHLFLSPIYLEKVNYLSFLIIGVMLGLFIMAYHIASYIFYSYRFPFLATFNRPLYTFSINNSIIPILFYIFYTVMIARSHYQNHISFFETFLNIGALYGGSIIIIALAFTYFFTTTKDLVITDPKLKNRIEKALNVIINKDEIRKGRTDFDPGVSTYFNSKMQYRLIRDVRHYPRQLLLDTLQQHHVNAAIFFLLIFLCLLLLSIFSAVEAFTLPAGGSLILLLTMYLMVTGALYSRFKTWSISIGLLGLILFNYVSGFDIFSKTYPAFGMNYTVPPAEYNYERLKTFVTDSIYDRDRTEMLEVLENWKSRQSSEGGKPRMILINSSGGGLRASLWTFALMQRLDSLSGGNFMDNTFMISGSSGGMIGAAYYRELLLMDSLNSIAPINSPIHLNNMGKDLLNPVAFHYAVNDLFFRTRRLKDGNYKYKIDRGYAFEERLNKNLHGIFTKRLRDYAEPEQRGEIPLLLLSPTIVEDGRRLIISPMGLSFMCYNKNPYNVNFSHDLDGVELSRFFADQDAGNLRFLTALRMSATFPYITPLVSLPSDPSRSVIDAGARDNEGFSMTLRFLYEFKDWLAENTSGVTIVRMKADKMDDIGILEDRQTNRIYSLIKPIGGVFTSFYNYQYFSKSLLLSFAQDWIDFDLDFVSFPLIRLDNEISLSWQLTVNEKKIILEELNSERMSKVMEELLGKVEE